MEKNTNYSLDTCPCDPDQAYTDCCQLFHQGKKHPPDAESLMRSRYSAYALGLADYLINTTHRDNVQYQRNIKRWRQEINDYCQQCQFQKLIIHQHQPGATEACVSFEAHIFQNGQPLVLKENSHFTKIGHRWLYHSGVLDIQPT